MGLSLSGSLVAVVTPMTAAGEVDWAAWERLVEWHFAAGTDGLVAAALAALPRSQAA